MMWVLSAQPPGASLLPATCPGGNRARPLTVTPQPTNTTPTPRRPPANYLTKVMVKGKAP